MAAITSTYTSFSDEVPFAVQGSNIPEVAHVSSTLDHVYMRLYTNNDNSAFAENTASGVVLGSSNYDKSNGTFGKNNIYLGGIWQNALSSFAIFDESRAWFSCNVSVGGNVAIGGSGYMLLPSGRTSERPPNNVVLPGMMRYNSTLGTFEGYSAQAGGWGSLGAGNQIETIDDLNYVTTVQETCNILFGTAGIERMRVQSNGHVGIGTTDNLEGYRLDVRGSAVVSNDLLINRLLVNKISPANDSNIIDFSNATLSNVRNIINSLWTNSISTNPNTPGSNIDFNQTTASNLKGLYSDTIYTQAIVSTNGPPNENVIYFNNARILDVDSIIVRSNLTVILQSDISYVNLPSDVVRLMDGHIHDALLPTNVVRLNETGVIDPSLLPTIDGDKKMFMHTSDRVGIGLRTPQQKLHVYGNQCIEAGSLIIGDVIPAARCHVVEHAGGTAMKIEQRGPQTILDIQGSNGAPALFIHGNRSVGIQTSNPDTSYALDVAGNTRIKGKLSCPHLESETGTIELTACIMSNALSVDTSDADVRGTLRVNTMTTLNTNAATPVGNTGSIHVNCGMFVTGYDASLGLSGYETTFGYSTDYSKIGLRVDYNAIADGYLTLSDRRLKENIQNIDATEDLKRLLKLEVKKYSFTNKCKEKETVGFIAQDVEPLFPHVVKTIADVKTGISDLKLMDMSLLVPSLCSAIQTLHRTVERQQKALDALLARMDIDIDIDHAYV